MAKQSPSPRKKLPESLTHDEEIEREEATDSESGSEDGSETSESGSQTEGSPLPPATASASASAPPSGSAPPVVATTSSASDSSSSEEDGSETGETASETEATLPATASASAPLSASATPIVAATGSGVVSTLRKRPSASTDIATKRTKIGEETDDTEKKAAQRVWSKKDEIEILKGIVNFKTKTGKDPSRDHSAIYNMVKGSYYLEGKSYEQFSSKISVLKKKYLRKNQTFEKAHDLKCFNLCRKIWVNNVVSSVRVDGDDWFEKSKLLGDITRSGEVGEGSVRVDGNDWLEKSKLLGDITRSGEVDEGYAMLKWRLVSVEMRKKLEDKWKLVRALELQHVMVRSELVAEVISAIYNARDP